MKLLKEVNIKLKEENRRLRLEENRRLKVVEHGVNYAAATMVNPSNEDELSIAEPTNQERNGIEDIVV